MKDQEIVRIIQDVQTAEEKVIKQLRAEKKATGDYSKVVTLPYGDMEMRFEVLQYRDLSYPSIGKNLLHSVSVIKGGEVVISGLIQPLSKDYDYKKAVWATVCDHSHIPPLLNSGDIICINNDGKCAYARAEILSTEINGDDIVRNLRLTKVLGHQEVLAYEKYGDMHTYVVDDSTEEYFKGKDVIKKTLETYYSKEERSYEDTSWWVYSEETIAYNSPIEFGIPVTKDEMIQRQKEYALNKLLEDCRGEFCYGDRCVLDRKDRYTILGEDNVGTIYQHFMTWLNKNCTRYTQEASDFTGVAVDWQGKEDYQPHFDVQEDKVRIEYYDDLWEKLPLTPYRDFLIISYCKNRHLDEPYDNLLDFFRNAASNGKVCLTLFKLGYDPRSVASFFSKLTSDLENVFVDAIKKLDRAYETYADYYDDYERECKTLLGRKN